jgi:hypothetical protein
MTDKYGRQLYRVTRQFVSGNLAGLTYTEVTPVPMNVGRRYEPCAGSSAYVILECVEV